MLVEMGEHFYKKIIPRLKKVAFSSEWKNGKLKNDKQVNPVSIAFRYYELESYEEALKECEYVLGEACSTKPHNEESRAKDYIKAQKIIDYRKSRKLIKTLNKSEKITLDMSGYREDFDIFHTLANLQGLRIKRLFFNSQGVESCEFDNGSVVSKEQVDLHTYPKLKNLIWWE